MADKRIVVDLDGTLCSQEEFGRYEYAEPRREVIDRLKELAVAGFHITIFTARGMKTFDGNVSEAKKHLLWLTKRWLKEHQVPYHRLRFGKPPADYYLDDKALTIDDFLARKEL